MPSNRTLGDRMEPPDDATRVQRFCIAVTRRLHPLLVREPERVVLAAAIFLVGVASLLATQQPGTIAAVLPTWVLVEWAVTLTLGGAFTLAGMFIGRRLLERCGLALTVIGAFTYAAALVSQGGPRAWIVALAFLGITTCSCIRLAVSTAVHATVKPADPGGE